MEYRKVQFIAGKGAAPTQFNATITGVAVDAHGQIYAAGDAEIKVFDAAGTLKRRCTGSRPVHSVTIGADGSIFAGEAGQIEIFDSTGKLINSWRNAELLGRVTAIAFVKDGVLAGDAAGRAIRHLDRGGKFLNDIGKNNPVNGFLIPNGVISFSVDHEGAIYAANPGKHRVERYLPSGELLGHFGRFNGVDPAGFPGCCNPTNLTMAGRDAIVVTEKAGPRVKMYDLGGKLLAVIAGNPAPEVFDPNCKNMAAAADAHGRVYVADTVKLGIFVFEPSN